MVTQIVQIKGKEYLQLTPAKVVGRMMGVFDERKYSSNSVSSFADGDCRHMRRESVEKQMSDAADLYNKKYGKTWDGKQLIIGGKQAAYLVKSLMLPLLDENKKITSLSIENKDVNMQLDIPDCGLLTDNVNILLSKILEVAKGEMRVDITNAHNGDEGLKITFNYTAATSEGDRRHILAYSGMAKQLSEYGFHMVEYPEFATQMSRAMDKSEMYRSMLGPWDEKVSVFIPSAATTAKKKAEREKQKVSD